MTIPLPQSVCTDQAVLDENLNVKVDNSPDFAGMSREEALRDLRKRIALYESVYETLSGAEDAYCYIKLYNLSSKVCSMLFICELLPFGASMLLASL